MAQYKLMPSSISTFMTTQELKPIDQGDRIIIVDILRGWALIGVVLVNYFLFFYLPPNADIPQNEYASHISRLLSDIFFTNKSRIMLNVLFGFGFATVINNVAQKGLNPVPFFAKRMFWLFIIGVINTCFYYGDFLKDYAIVGLMMLLFYKTDKKVSLYVAIFLMLLYPATGDFFGNKEIIQTQPTALALYQSHNLFNVLSYGFFEGTKELYSLGRLLGINFFVLSCFLVGQYFYRIDFFRKIVNGDISAKKMFWTSLITTISVAVITNVIFKVFKSNFLKHYDTTFWLEFGLMLVFLSAICWLYKQNKLKRFFASLQTVGKMTLTNYVVQNIISILLFSGFGLGLLGKLPLFAYILIALTIYIAQTFFSKWWLSKYNYGLVEWIWRQLTYMKKLPLKKP